MTCAHERLELTGADGIHHQHVQRRVRPISVEMIRGQPSRLAHRQFVPELSPPARSSLLVCGLSAAVGRKKRKRERREDPLVDPCPARAEDVDERRRDHDVARHLNGRAHGRQPLQDAERELHTIQSESQRYTRNFAPNRQDTRPDGKRRSASAQYPKRDHKSGRAFTHGKRKPVSEGV